MNPLPRQLCLTWNNRGATQTGLFADCAGRADAAKLEKIGRIETTLYEVKSDVEVIKKVVTWHSEEIRQLKKAQ